ncbi:prepilin peptidase [Roseomonas sp. CAU 1739]|uniref:prepilin peptidase n=1 Tax=Roseomonas sp. CAU 1739 TaxID=3140364 RepID=UPI00325AEF41
MVPLPPDILALALVVLALLLLLAAALGDIACRRIPNRIASLVALVGLLRQGLSGGAVLGVALLLAGLVFLGAALLWLRGALGGGDVKLLAAAALLVPPALVPTQLLAVALAGGALALFHLGLRPLLRAPSPGGLPRGRLRRALRREARRIRKGAPLPYGVAIALGTAIILIRPEA